MTTFDAPDRDAVYDVLVEEVGAPEDGRDAFKRAWPECVEWRFGGTLGYGGKVWHRRHTAIPVHVTCYPEDITPERRDAIDRANRRFINGEGWDDDRAEGSHDG